MPRRQQAVKLKGKTPNTLRLRDDATIDRLAELRERTVEVPFSYPSYKLTSKAALPTCPETCETCVQHYLPESKDWNPEDLRPMVAHSDIEAAQVTSDYVKCINADRDAIRARLEMDADLLLKRWQRKSVEKRAKIVRTAMPELHPRRFQNAWLFYDQKRNAKEYGSSREKDVLSLSVDHAMAEAVQAMKIYHDSHRKQYLLPFLDVETLSQDPMSLLALLHYRSDSDMADWVMHDCKRLDSGFNWTMGPPAFNPHCVIMYGIHLGRLIPWNKQSAHRHDIIGYPRAVLILEAQAVLFTFLRKTVEVLLEPGVQEMAAGHQQWDALVQSDFGKIGPTPSVCRRTEAFRSPSRLDMAAIVRSLAERTDALTDELWLQQIDPEYFRTHLAQAKNNETYDRMDMEQREQWLLGFASCYSVWADNLRTARKQAWRLLKVQKEIGSEVRPGKSLPPVFEVVLVLFQEYLEQLFEGQVLDLKCLVPQERYFREYFRVSETGRPIITISAEKLFLANPMLWNLSRLYTAHESQPPTFHLAFIDYLMCEDTKNERNRISPLLAMHISNMIAIDDILSSLRHHRPQHGVSADAGELAEFAVGRPRSLPGRDQAAFGRYIVGHVIWPPLQTFMELPLPPSDEPAVLLKHLRPLDEALLAFWRVACGYFMLLISASDQRHELFNEPAGFTLFGATPEETERRALRYAQLERAATEQESCKGPQSSRPPNPPPPGATTQTTWGESAAPITVKRRQMKPKTKTRPTVPPTSSSYDATWDAEPVAPLRSQQASILVSSDSLTLFTRTFTADPSAPSEIYWTEFVSAMADAGCSVTPGGGSCFTFSHVDEEGQKHSMVFHRPHPEPSMSKERLRSFGSRLNRRWGWSETTFCLKA